MILLFEISSDEVYWSSCASSRNDSFYEYVLEDSLRWDGDSGHILQTSLVSLHDIYIHIKVFEKLVKIKISIANDKVSKFINRDTWDAENSMLEAKDCFDFD